MKLDGALARIEREGERLLCGGGARLPPGRGPRGARGPHRPGVRREHPRHRRGRGADERQRLRRRPLARARVGRRGHRPRHRPAHARRARVRLPPLQPGPARGGGRGSFALAPAPPGEVKATLADMRSNRRAAQPSGIKTFGSTFKNPDDPRAEGRSAGVLLDEAGCRGLRVGGARFSEKHANFVENEGEATTADVVALMAEGRRRVRERFGVELEPEVQLLGPVDAGTGLSRERRRRGALRRLRGARPRRRAAPRRAGCCAADSPALRRRLRGAGAVGACCSALYMLWLRDARLVAVDQAHVTGAAGKDAGQIRRALQAAAGDMTTLHVRHDEPRCARCATSRWSTSRTPDRLPAQAEHHRDRAPARGRGRGRAAGSRWPATAPCSPARRPRRRCPRSRSGRRRSRPAPDPEQHARRRRVLGAPRPP